MRKHSGLAAVAAAGAVALGWLTWHGLGKNSLRGDNLHDEVALVTGGSRGLGWLIARELGRNGCQIAICARDEAELAAAEQRLQAEGIHVFTVRCDLKDPAAITAMVDAVTAHYGRIDILVNNAGIIQVGPVEQMEEVDFHAAMDVIFWGTQRTTAAVLPQMLQRRRGRIVNITSIGGLVSVPHLLPYSAAKFATVGLSQGLHEELRGKGIHVTTIAPSTLRTGSHLQAQFHGNRAAEYTWFGLSASLPFISTSAETAAAVVVGAIKRRTAFQYIGWPAHLAGRVHGLLPGVTATLLSLVDRYGLPKSPRVSLRPLPGHVVDAELRPSQRQWRHWLMALGQRAAQRYQGFPRQEGYPSQESAQQHYAE